MFTSPDQLADGQGWQTAALAASAPGRFGQWRHAAGDRFDRFCNAHDLAEDIGSVQWFRGLGSMLGLGFVALAFWPDFTAVEAATMRPADGGVRDEYRSQMIMPLALGADNGKHMAATDRVRPLTAMPERTQVTLTATLARGDSFGRMLQRAGANADDAARAAELVAGAVPLDQIASGTRIEMTLGARGESGGARPLQKLAFQARFDLALAVDRSGGGLTLERKPIAVSSAPLRISGTVGNGLYRAARAAGAPVKAIQDYLRTIGQRISIEGDVAPTDKFDMVVSYKRSATGEVQAGDLLYAALQRDGKAQVELLRWGKDGQFYEASGTGAAQRTVNVTRVSQVPNFAGSLSSGSPVNGRMTSGYGPRRHPILGYARMHAGIDFGAAWGSPIFATGDAMVSYAGRHGGHGNYVRLDHGGGLGTGYGHMSRIAVAPGMRVRAGQVIGYVGSTGLSTGPHLHYEVYQNGRTVNPLCVRMGGGYSAGSGGGYSTVTTTVAVSQVDQKELAAFKAKLVQLKAIKPAL